MSYKPAKVADAARLALKPVRDPMVEAERAESRAQEAAALSAAHAERAEHAAKRAKAEAAKVKQAEHLAKDAKLAAEKAANEAIAAEHKARTLDKLAVEAREEAKEIGVPTAMTKSSSKHVSPPPMGVWDVHLAVHCVKPTGKSQRENRQMKTAIENAREAAETVTVAWREASRALEAGRVELSRLEREEVTAAPKGRKGYAKATQRPFSDSLNSRARFTLCWLCCLHRISAAGEACQGQGWCAQHARHSGRSAERRSQQDPPAVALPAHARDDARGVAECARAATQTTELIAYAWACRVWSGGVRGERRGRFVAAVLDVAMWDCLEDSSPRLASALVCLLPCFSLGVPLALL